MSRMSFPEWAFSTVDKLRKAVGIGSLLAAAIAIKWVTSTPDAWSKITQDLGAFLEERKSERAVLLGLQAATCILLAVLIPKPRETLRDLVPNITLEREALAVRACRRIHALIVTVFVFWAMYYVVSALAVFNGPLTVFDKCVLLTISTVTSFVIYCLYVELSALTLVHDDAPPNNGSHVLQYEKGLWSSLGGVVTQRVLAALSFLGAVVLVWYGYGRELPSIIRTCDLAIGFAGGITLCLVVGRLGSKFLDPGPMTLCALYLYGLLQPLAPLFDSEPIVFVAATTLALPLKVLLWMVCVWASTTGILAEYVYELRVLIEKLKIEKKGKDRIDIDEEELP